MLMQDLVRRYVEEAPTPLSESTCLKTKVSKFASL